MTSQGLERWAKLIFRDTADLITDPDLPTLFL